MTGDDRKPPATSASTQVEAFLRQVACLPEAGGGQPGRLVFAMDATASREQRWREATRIQSEMFHETAALGGLEVQLVYYRGLSECRASRWLSDAETLSTLMGKVDCIGGRTQIGRVLRHCIDQTSQRRINALVFIGDCMEEPVDPLCALAGALRVLGVPLFLFHEGDDRTAAAAFAQMARISGGAVCRFDRTSPQQLKALLGAVAVYAAGGRKALVEYGARHGGMVLLLTDQLKGG